MTAYNLKPAGLATTNAFARLGGDIPANEEWSTKLRVVPMGSVTDYVSIQIRDSDGVTVLAQCCNNHDVQPGAAGTFDIEPVLPLTTGCQIWAKSSGGTIAVRLLGTKRSTA